MLLEHQLRSVSTALKRPGPMLGGYVSLDDFWRNIRVFFAADCFTGPTLLPRCGPGSVKQGHLAMVVLLIALASVDANPGKSDPSAPPEAPPQRVRSVLLSPGQKCPVAQQNEVIVCAPLEQPYRIPNALRRSEIAQRTQSWANRVATMDELGRTSGGLPNTCSVVGTGGQTGCMQSMMRAWAAERRALASGLEHLP